MDIAGSIATIQTAYGLAKSVVAGKVDAEVKAKASELVDSIINLQGVILSLQSKNQELLETNRLLKDQLSDLRQWEAVANSYKLCEVSEGIFLYSLVQDSTEPHHYVCPNCFNNKNKSILQISKEKYKGTWYVCLATDCKMQILDGSTREPLPPAKPLWS